MKTLGLNWENLLGVKRLKSTKIIYIYMGKFDHDLTATSLEIMVNKGNHPQMALIQVSEIL